MDTSTIISIVSLGLCALFFIYSNAYIRRRTGQKRILADFKDEVSKLIAEIDTATDRDATLIEDRIKTIRALLDEVDKRIMLYDQEVAKRRANEEMYAELGRRRIAEAHISTSYNPALQNNTPPSVMSLDNEVSIQSLLKKDRGAEVDKKDKISEDRTKEMPHTIYDEQKYILEQITELSKAGFSSNLIAARLGMSISEVELAIAIAERRS
ncbi:MAG: hypothetical protein LBP19_00165 [Treponema sp.]|jgi:hypothetical protein|nr:hypothetical protein [Treponema sp.]